MRVLFTPRAKQRGSKPPPTVRVQKALEAADKFAAECAFSDSMSFDNASVVVGPQPKPKDIVASELHCNIRLRMFDSPEMAKKAGTRSQSPLQKVEPDALLQALKRTLPGTRPIAGIYIDSDESGGSVLVRICISDVRYLYKLRDSLMLARFGVLLSKELGHCVRIDTADFVAKYQACLEARAGAGGRRRVARPRTRRRRSRRVARVLCCRGPSDS